ncbi:hypothetical protein BU26DRAFT_100635 [Trematosphaeria pertusa]|uniref:DUF7053 domain-containing protein n=1 Tax=Trematosphaeria pertusa TaxID=390896 RepID=A0A6A6I325_9PLEO|nr:uncharacterized protein BU26DRAFT_100635 [Trematosphaeria pertusa]KAF2244398.1 hypothetical protein BU26DRAFT_100635 [Trematosphaeria pertusa]
MMRKKTTYTQITPIPSYIPRQLAVDLLHSHGEIIELNPLVLSFEGIKAPRDAPADEFYSTWYEITERIQYIPGIGKLGSGVIRFRGCFHDMPWGLQTHTYAPAGVDLRNKWQVCGNQPGEPPETRELGIGAPPEGLYLREDIEIKCNVTMVGFVKKEMKAAALKMVERLIKKAELLDAGALHAMMENGRLTTINPADRSSHAPRPHSPLPSPKQPYNMPMSPNRSSTFPQQMQAQQYPPPNHAQGHNNIVMELPGDFYHPPQSPNHLQPNDHRYSTASELSGHSPNPSDGRWSQVSNDYQSSMSSRPSSYASDGMRSPGLDQKGFSTELPTMQETREEHEDARRRLEGQQYAEDRKYRYNPQDFAQHTHQYAQPPQYSSYNHGR